MLLSFYRNMCAKFKVIIKNWIQINQLEKKFNYNWVDALKLIKKLLIYEKTAVLLTNNYIYVVVNRFSAGTTKGFEINNNQWIKASNVKIRSKKYDSKFMS